MVADMLRSFSVVVVSSTLTSLIVSFTLVPYLASRFSSAKQPHYRLLLKVSSWIEEHIDRTINEITRGLSWSFHHEKMILFCVVVLFAGSILLIPTGFIGVEFTKLGDRSEFIMELELNPNSTLQETDNVSKHVEAILRSYKDVETVYTNVGLTSSGRIISNSQYLSEVYVRLFPGMTGVIKHRNSHVM